MGDFSTRIQGGLGGAIPFAGSPSGPGILSISSAAAVRVQYDSTQPQQQFVISNLSSVVTAACLFVCDGGGVEALAIFPQQSVTLETDSAFSIKSDSATLTPFVLGRLIARGLSLGSQARAGAQAPAGGGGGGGGAGGGGGTSGSGSGRRTYQP